jgi:sulfhydrogenase subunit gamma (sulfur reductase)
VADPIRATVERSFAETPTLTSLRISLAGTSLAETHRIAGQYARLGLPGGADAIFAIASAPGAGPYFEFLLKRGAPVADALAQLGAGAAVQLTPAAGKGFPLDAARGQDLLLVATGSGISAIRSVIGAVKATRASFGAVTLLYGVHSARDVAYARELDDWRSSAIDVLPTAAQAQPSWAGKVGWVEKWVPERIDSSRTWAFLCGRKEMVRDVTALLIERGIPKDRVSLNF